MPLAIDCGIWMGGTLRKLEKMSGVGRAAAMRQQNAAGAHGVTSAYLLGLFGDAGVGFDLDAPLGVEQCGDDDHSGGRPGERKKLAMYAAGCLPIFGVGEIHAGAVDVLNGAARSFERRGDDGETLISLLSDIGLVRAYRTGAGDVDVVADADGAGEADDGFKGAGAGNVGAGCSPSQRTTCSLVSS